MNNDRHWEHSDEDICVPVVQFVTEEGTWEDLDEMRPIRLVRFFSVVVGIISQYSHSQISRINRLSSQLQGSEKGTA